MESRNKLIKAFLYSLLFVALVVLVYIVSMDIGVLFLIVTNDPRTIEIPNVCSMFFGVAVALSVVFLCFIYLVYGVKDLHFKISFVIFSSLTSIIFVMNLVYFIWMSIVK